jgi:hypothetical protein
MTEIFTIIMANALIMVQVNPYGAVVYAVLMGTLTPNTVGETFAYTMLAYAIMLLSTLLWKGRTKN